MASQELITVDETIDPILNGGFGTFVPQPRVSLIDPNLPAFDGSFGGGAVVVYTMRATQNGSATVYWENEGSPDNTGTGTNAPSGTLTDIGTIAVESR